MQKKLCVCIPTYNREHIVARKLEHEIPFLKKYQTDVFVYDSSPDGGSENVVSAFQNRGYNNLFYIEDKNVKSSNEKVFQIYQELENKEYDYVWIIHDHTVCNEQALIYILNALSYEQDFYLLKMQESQFSMHIYASLNEFILDGAWTLNSFGTAIVSRATFLQGCNWEQMKIKYLNGKTHNYSHVGFYFERAAQIKNIKIAKLDFLRECFYDFMRYEKPSWYSETLRICLECWGETIKKLPEVYVCKTEVLQTQDRGFLSKYKLIEYKKQRLFNFCDFLKYRKWMKLIIPEIYFDAAKIALLPYYWVNSIYNADLVNKIRHAREEGKKICIYGAGRHAYECMEHLENNGYNIDCFLVTDLSGNPHEISIYPVFEAKEYIEKESAFIIIAILTSGVKEVESYLKTIGVCDTDIVLFSD